MSIQLRDTTFLLDDRVDGRPLTPATVDLPTLRAFLSDVETLLKGNLPGASLADSRVRIQDGSVKVVALVAQLIAQDFLSDMSRLEASGDLDLIQPKRAEIIEDWQSKARRMPERSYRIVTTPNGAGLRIGKDSLLEHGKEKVWVAVEKYLTGKVTNLGGKQNPNIHLTLADTRQAIIVNAAEKQLSAEKENLIYKNVTIRVSAEQHLETKLLRNLRLIQFVPQSAEIDESQLLFLWEKGRAAWKDVASASEWVESLRGNN